MSNPGPIFLCGAIEKGKEDLLMEMKTVNSLAKGWKVKLYFQTRAFQLTMRTDFLFCILSAESCGPSYIHCPDRMTLLREGQNLSSVQPRILTFTSHLWAQVERKLPDIYQRPLFVTSSKSVWANIKYQMLLEATNLK